MVCFSTYTVNIILIHNFMNKTTILAVLFFIVVVIVVILTVVTTTVLLSRKSLCSSPGLLQSIPRVFVRTGPWDHADVPPAAKAAMDASLALNPGYVLKYFSHRDVDEFIATHFPQFIALYHSLVPGAYRADLWRLLYLYKYGGVYNDVGNIYKVPLDSFIHPDDGFVASAEIVLPWALHNAFIAAHPMHPLVHSMIELVVENVRNKSYGENSIDITGPATLGRAFNRFFGRADKIPLPLGRQTLNGLVINFAGQYHGSGDVDERYIKDMSGKALIKCKFPGYMDAVYKNRNEKYYGQIYKEGGVFR